jgi:hypothetical protein
LLITDIEHQLDGAQPVAVVLDTLNRSLVGSESSDEDTGPAKLALELLRQIIASDGETPPANNNMPTGQIRAVRWSLWGRFCKAGIAGDETQPDSKQKAFVRAAKRLQELGLIGVWDEWVWLADKPDKGGQI